MFSSRQTPSPPQQGMWFQSHPYTTIGCSRFFRILGVGLIWMSFWRWEKSLANMGFSRRDGRRFSRPSKISGRKGSSSSGQEVGMAQSGLRQEMRAHRCGNIRMKGGITTCAECCLWEPDCYKANANVCDLKADADDCVIMARELGGKLNWKWAGHLEFFERRVCSEGNRNATRVYNLGIAHAYVHRQYHHITALYHLPRNTACISLFLNFFSLLKVTEEKEVGLYNAHGEWKGKLEVIQLLSRISNEFIPIDTWKLRHSFPSIWGRMALSFFVRQHTEEAATCLYSSTMCQDVDIRNILCRVLRCLTYWCHIEKPIKNRTLIQATQGFEALVWDIGPQIFWMQEKLRDLLRFYELTIKQKFNPFDDSEFECPLIGAPNLPEVGLEDGCLRLSRLLFN